MQPKIKLVAKTRQVLDTRDLIAGHVYLSLDGTPYMKVSSGGLVHLESGRYISTPAARSYSFKQITSADINIVE
jgi:hypothetical protein